MAASAIEPSQTVTMLFAAHAAITGRTEPRAVKTQRFIDADANTHGKKTRPASTNQSDGYIVHSRRNAKVRNAQMAYKQYDRNRIGIALCGNWKCVNGERSPAKIPSAPTSTPRFQNNIAITTTARPTNSVPPSRQINQSAIAIAACDANP